MPEVLWKSYIDFEIEQGERQNTVNLYRRLLDRTKHVKVWISFAQFERSSGRMQEARAVFEEAYNYLRSAEQKEERVLLVQNWKQFEEEVADAEALAHVVRLFPKRIKKKRQIKAEDGSNAGWEEYYDYVFPDEQAAIPNLKILQRAHQWKTGQT